MKKPPHACPPFIFLSSSPAHTVGDGHPGRRPHSPFRRAAVPCLAGPDAGALPAPRPPARPARALGAGRGTLRRDSARDGGDRRLSDAAARRGQVLREAPSLLLGRGG